MAEYEAKHQWPGQPEWVLSPDFLLLLRDEATQKPIGNDLTPDWNKYVTSLQARYVNTKSFRAIRKKAVAICWASSAEFPTEGAIEDKIEPFHTGCMLGLRVAEAVLGNDFDEQLSKISQEPYELFGNTVPEHIAKQLPEAIILARLGLSRVASAETIIRELLPIFSYQQFAFAENGFGYLLYHVAILEDSRREQDIAQMNQEAAAFKPDDFIRQILDSQGPKGL